MPEFTFQQLLDFAAYLKVQQRGAFNMLSPQAQAAAGLPRDRYLFVIENYNALKEAAAKDKTE